MREYRMRIDIPKKWADRRGTRHTDTTIIFHTRMNRETGR